MTVKPFYTVVIVCLHVCMCIRYLYNIINYYSVGRQREMCWRNNRSLSLEMRNMSTVQLHRDRVRFTKSHFLRIFCVPFLWTTMMKFAITAKSVSSQNPKLRKRFPS